ncbi:MAG TPA: PD-(D/E)XK nuclease family protein [Ignavibacteriales bacterium]|nr:PD-(D/E)XK nuclease family protein [Ignavibacteriales bacterium]
MILTKENINAVNTDELIQEKLSTSRLNELLLIVPTKRKARIEKKELVSRTPGGAAGSINIETIGTISTRLLSHKVKFKPVSEAASAVLLKQSVAETKLCYFSGYKHEVPSGTLERVHNVISEYKRHGITPQHLRQEADKCSGAEANKALDIANIYEKFRENCSRLLAKETGDIYAELNEFTGQEFKEAFRSYYPDVNLIIINGFDEFTNPETEIINSLSLVEGTKVFINFDYYSFNTLIFSHLKECYNRLLSKGFSIVTDRASVHQGEFRDYVKESLFERQPKVPVSKYKDLITRLEASDREKEIEIIAKEIKNILLEEKAEPHRICVAFNLIEKYSPLIRDVFTNYGIPFNLTDRIWLENSTPIIAIINFLEVLENDFYFKNIFRALSGSFLNFDRISLSNLMRVAARQKIVAGYDSWTGRLKEAITAIDQSRDSADPFLAKEKSIYEKALKDIRLLHELLSPFDRKMTLKEFMLGFHRLIDLLELPKRILNRQSSRQEENIKSISTFLETISEVFELYEKEFSKAERFPLKFYLEKIRTAVSSARFNVQEKSSCGVLVTTLNEIRGLKFDYLFISGLSDGDMPTRYSPEIFYSGSYAKNEMIHQTEERYRFYQSLCTWEKGLYLSFPSKEDSRELIESSFLKEFCTLFETNVKKEDDYKDLIYSREELLKLTGKAGPQEIRKAFPSLDGRFNWEHLENSIKITSLRIKDPFKETAFTGILNPDGENGTDGIPAPEISKEALETLLSAKDAQYSITQLEKYALCPFQYFLSRILGIEVIKEPSEDIESFELGSLLHSILYEFYSRLSKKGMRLSGCRDDEFCQAEEMIFEIAENKIKEAALYSPMSFYEKERITGIDGVRRNSILYKFLEAERSDSLGLTPKFFEVNFGAVSGDEKDATLSGARTFTIGKNKIRGKIDRIDINESAGIFSVVDYKLNGKKPSRDELKEGLSLQLPLYMYAASEMLKSLYDDDYNPVAAYIYSLKYKADEFGRIAVTFKTDKAFCDLSEEERQEAVLANSNLIKACEESIEKYIENISKGKFNLSSLKDRDTKVCRYCDYKSVCRIEEMEG